MSGYTLRWRSLLWNTLIGSSTALSPYINSALVPSREQQPQPPVIVRFSINDTANIVHKSTGALQLVHSLAGTRPVEYRVSVRADFQNALWLPYTPNTQLTGWQAFLQSVAKTGNGCGGRSDAVRLQLFLQVRSDLGGTVTIVNGQRVVVPQKVESNVVSDTICVIDNR